MRVTIVPPQPPPPAYKLELTEKEMLHLAVTLYMREPYDQGASLYQELPESVRNRVQSMREDEKRSRLDAGWRKRDDPSRPDVEL